MKILYENTDKPINQVWLTFPMPGNNAVIRMIPLTKGHESESNITYRIAAVDSPIRNLIKYLTADMPLVKLSELAEKIRDMGKEDCLKFSGVLDWYYVKKKYKLNVNFLSYSYKVRNNYSCAAFYLLIFVSHFSYFFPDKPFYRPLL